MIELINIEKSYENYKAIDGISFNIKDNCVFGLIGTNGAGKSTILRILSGIMRVDNGTVLVDGLPVFENPNAKQNIFYLSDDQYFSNYDTPMDMAKFYNGIYSKFSLEVFQDILNKFKLNKDSKIGGFSKGMKKQIQIALAIASNAKYILLDETFDGLDPINRLIVKNILVEEVEKRDLVPIIASHNLRELEDIADNVGFIHKGKLVVQSDLENMKLGIHKCQLVLQEDQVADTEKTIKDLGLNVLHTKNMGSLYIVTIRGGEEDIQAKINSLNPIFFEMLPLTLEEIFISETEAITNAK